MNKYLKKIVLFLLTLVIAISAVFPAFAASGKWIKSGNRWWYRHADYSYTSNDWEKINNKWYHFDKNGWMQTGWIKDKGKWYYLNANGDMRTGWLKYKNKWYYLNTNGSMRTEWLKDKGKWYYLNDNGDMVTGWKNISGTQYYFNKSGAMVTGWQDIGNNRYFFDENGSMHTGFYYQDLDKIHFDVYYFKSNGAMVTGWIQIPEIYNTWFYFDEQGKEQRNKFVDGYFLNEYGRRAEFKPISFDKEVTGITIEYHNEKDKDDIKIVSTEDAEKIEQIITILTNGTLATINDIGDTFTQGSLYYLTLRFDDGTETTYLIDEGKNQMRFNWTEFKVNLKQILEVLPIE